MRRLAGLLFLCLLLCGCGVRSASWHYELGTWYDADDHLAGDSGKLIAWYELELPRLKLVSDGATRGAEPPTELAAARDAFNAEMESLRDQLMREYRALRSDAVGGYVESGDTPWYEPAGVEMHIADTRLSGRLAAVRAEACVDYSGAHPWFCARAWNYDLKAGRFVQWYDLTDDPDALRAALAAAAAEQAREQSGRFYGGWESALADMDAVYFGAEGFVLCYHEGTLGGHAALAPTFTVPYDAVESLLTPYGRQLTA